ncbi:MAG: hypothetical protein K2X38_11335 [Gemmataceae bacterium]|nr:hypothetical protein [Gemmataceae bacterium]
MTGIILGGGALTLLLSAAKVALDMAAYRQTMDRPKKPWEREPDHLTGSH